MPANLVSGPLKACNNPWIVQQVNPVSNEKSFTTKGRQEEEHEEEFQERHTISVTAQTTKV